jgi:hypothetical protein
MRPIELAETPLLQAVRHSTYSFVHLNLSSGSDTNQLVDFANSSGSNNLFRKFDEQKGGNETLTHIA